jgi:hypothetical protein
MAPVIRVDHIRVANTNFGSKSEGRRKVRRPRLRCEKNVESDLRELKVKGWRQKANTREEWISVIKETQVLGGPQSPIVRSK